MHPILGSFVATLNNRDFLRLRLRLRISHPAIPTKQATMMQAAVYRSFGGEIKIESIDRPKAPADGVVIRVKATGVCRSDWHGWKGHDSDIADHGLPFVPGHEVSGVVVEIGNGVRKFRIGDRVAVPFILSCGCCRECDPGGRNRPTICERQEQPGFTMLGSFACLAVVGWDCRAL